MCQVATVVMETTQLVLSHLKTSHRSQLRIEAGLFLPKITSKCCELVKLCHINCRFSFFGTQCSCIKYIACKGYFRPLIKVYFLNVYKMFAV